MTGDLPRVHLGKTPQHAVVSGGCLTSTVAQKRWQDIAG